MAADFGIDGLRDVNLVRAESSAVLGYNSRTIAGLFHHVGNSSSPVS